GVAQRLQRRGRGGGIARRAGALVPETRLHARAQLGQQLGVLALDVGESGRVLRQVVELVARARADAEAHQLEAASVQRAAVVRGADVIAIVDPALARGSV